MPSSVVAIVGDAEWLAAMSPEVAESPVLISAKLSLLTVDFGLAQI